MDRDYVRYVARSSMLCWWPRVKGLNVPKPETYIIEVTEEDEEELWKRRAPPSLVGAIASAAVKVGFPLFLRTDLVSGKHEWRDTCYVKRAGEIGEHLVGLYWYSIALTPPMPVGAFVVREFVELGWGFKAFGGLPIAPERRYLVDGGKVLAHFPYWPEDSIRFWGREPPSDWREKLRQMNTETDEEVELLTGYAERIGEVLGGFWSVDFARARDGTWYFIDAARGEVSWMPDSVAEKLRGMGYKVFA